MKPEITVEYNKATETLRQMPQNYLLAFRRESGGRWIEDPDLSADKEICQTLCGILLNFEARYGDGENLAKQVNLQLVTGQLVPKKLTEEQIANFGLAVALEFEVPKNPDNDRWIMATFGEKTNLGVGRTILRMLHDIRKDKMDIKYPDIKVDLFEQDGNIYSMVAKIRNYMRRNGVPEAEMDAFTKDIKGSNDYDEAVMKIMNWVTVK